MNDIDILKFYTENAGKECYIRSNCRRTYVVAGYATRCRPGKKVLEYILLYKEINQPTAIRERKDPQDTLFIAPEFNGKNVIAIRPFHLSFIVTKNQLKELITTLEL